MKKLSAYTYHPTIRQREKSSVESTLIPGSLVRICLLFSYLYYCLCKRVVPWHFFQLNSNYFNREKGIFSKLEMDAYIPEGRRLKQRPYDPDAPPEKFPVFVKPEWGQNSNGVRCIRNKDEFAVLGSEIARIDMNFVVQEAASGKREYEIYYLRSQEKKDEYAFFSITRVVNISTDDLPVNSIHNKDTTYVDITGEFSQSECLRLWRYIADIGDFRMARVGVKADNRADVIAGRFKVVEINLFLPMPLVLLSVNVSRSEKLTCIAEIMEQTASLVGSIPPDETGKWIFFRKLLAHYRVAL